MNEAILLITSSFFRLYKIYIIVGDIHYSHKSFFISKKQASHSAIDFLMRSNVRILNTPTFDVCDCGVCQIYLIKSETLRAFL